MTRKLAAVAPLVIALSVASRAMAEDLEVAEGETQPRSGTVVQTHVVIDGTVRVFDSNSNNPTYLYLKAESITVGPTGLIDANASGFRGTDTASNGPGAGGTAANPSADVPAPGGGGGHRGAGGEGSALGCMAFAEASGGIAYDGSIAVYDQSPAALVDTLAAMMLGFGSSGGASQSGAPNLHRARGGHGGGVVVLEAPEIRLEGRIRADGGAGSANLGEASGGGAGGLVWIISPNFSAGPGASISVRGGAGGVGNTLGGAGGGGLVVLSVNADVSALDVDASGGPAGVDPMTMTSCAITAGEAGQVDSTLSPPPCFDADGDGFESAACGGQDCDDGEADVNPTAIEVCDGTDNDCDGAIDTADVDAETQLCPPGQNSVCIEGACVEQDGGVGGSGAGVRSDDIEVGGGLCASAAGPLSGRAGHLAWLAAAAAALGLWRRRR